MATLKELKNNPGRLVEIDLKAWGIDLPCSPPGRWRAWREPWGLERSITTAQRLTQAAGPEVATTFAGLVLAVGRWVETREPLSESLGEAFPTDLAGLVKGLAQRFPDWHAEAASWLHDSVWLCQDGSAAGDNAPRMALYSDNNPATMEEIFHDRPLTMLELAGVVVIESLLPLDLSSAVRLGITKLRASVHGLKKSIGRKLDDARTGAAGSPTSPPTEA